MLKTIFVTSLPVGFAGLLAEFLAGPETLSLVTPVMALVGLLTAEATGIWLFG